MQSLDDSEVPSAAIVNPSQVRIEGQKLEEGEKGDKVIGEFKAEKNTSKLFKHVTSPVEFEKIVAAAGAINLPVFVSFHSLINKHCKDLRAPLDQIAEAANSKSE